MNKIQFLFLLICLFFLSHNSVFSQSEITGAIFTDSVMDKSLANVKIKFYASDGRVLGQVKTDTYGKFYFPITNNKKINTIVFKKKGYSSITINPFETTCSKCIYYIKVVLNKNYSIHDENYKGPSKVVSIEYEM